MSTTSFLLAFHDNVRTKLKNSDNFQAWLAEVVEEEVTADVANNYIIDFLTEDATTLAYHRRAIMLPVAPVEMRRISAGTGTAAFQWKKQVMIRFMQQLETG